jgi:dynein heavy chain
MEAKKVDMTQSEKLFGLDFTLYPELSEVGKDLEIMDILYSLYLEQKHARITWSQTLWVELDPQALVDGIDEFIRRFKALPKEVKISEVGKCFEEKMKDFKRAVPLFVDLKHEALRPRHWQDLMTKTGVHFDMAPDRFTLGALFKMELHRFADVIGDIIATAVRELQIEKIVKELTETWDNYKLNVIQFIKNEQNRGWIIGATDDMMQTLDDNMVTLQGISGSRFIGPFFKVVSQLEKSLSTISEVMDAWILTQRKWMYLEWIFSGGDIRSQLAEEAFKFDAIDKAVRSFMAEALKNPSVKAFTHVRHRLSELKGLIAGLDACQKSLNDYLQLKRNAFPRFYFISDDELLSILGTGTPPCVQEHMIKMFDNVASLKLIEIGGGVTEVHGMVSSENEEMDFRNVVECEGRVEEWMNFVVDEMRATNRFITKKAIYYYGMTIDIQKTRVEWMMEYQGMVILAANQVWWTCEIEEAFRRFNKRVSNIKVVPKYKSEKHTVYLQLLLYNLHGRF